MRATTRPPRDCHSIGKDEMNLLEYCIFSANDRVDRKTKSLVFEDFKGGRQRKLTVAFSAEYGRPTVRDDQILVALLKLTRDQGFQSATVNFTRYEILNILDWPNTGYYYKQVEHAFDRIRGTTLNWENAYWDHRAKEWATRKFSIIDDVELLDRGRYERIRQVSGEKQPRSWFRWSDVMFDSFAAGYIKTLDLDAFRSIQGDVAKRLYRWLDKHFKNPNRRLPIQLPLETLAVQKLGFRRAAPSHLQRMVVPAIAELERRGIIQPDGQRFSGSRRQLQVCFRPKRIGVSNRTGAAGAKSLSSSLVDALVHRGVKATVAKRLVRDKPDEVTIQLEVFDSQVASGWKPRSNPGGYLKEAIEQEFGRPNGFKTVKERTAERTANEKRENDRRIRAKQQETEADAGRVAHMNRMQAVNTWRQSMSESEWRRTEARLQSQLDSSGQSRWAMSEYERVRILFAHIPRLNADNG